MDTVFPTLYLHDTIDGNVVYTKHREYLQQYFPTLTTIFFGQKVQRNWYGFYLVLSKLYGRNNYLKCRAIVDELNFYLDKNPHNISFYHYLELKYKSQNLPLASSNQNEVEQQYQNNPLHIECLENPAMAAYHFHQQVLHLFTLNVETLLEFIIMLLSHPNSIMNYDATQHKHNNNDNSTPITSNTQYVTRLTANYSPKSFSFHEFIPHNARPSTQQQDDTQNSPTETTHTPPVMDEIVTCQKVVDFTDLLIPFQTYLYNLPAILDEVLCKLPPTPLLSAVYAGQVENVISLLKLPCVDINAKCWHFDTSIKKLIKERIDTATGSNVPSGVGNNNSSLNGYGLGNNEITKPVIHGLNASLIPYVPNKLLTPHPFPRDAISYYHIQRFLQYTIYHNLNNFIFFPISYTNNNNTNNSQQLSLLNKLDLTRPDHMMYYKKYILRYAHEAVIVFYTLLNYFGTILYTATTLITGTNNRKATQRSCLIQRNPVLYADKDEDTYPHPAPADVHPWFYPPSSPTKPDTRATQRSAAGTYHSKVPQIKYVHVAHDGTWKRVEDENINTFLKDEVKSKSTYLLASSKQPRTLLTDSMDLLMVLLRNGGEVLHHIVVLYKDYAADDNQDEEQNQQPKPLELLFDTNNTKNLPFVTILPIPLGLNDILPTNALTAISRISLRMGLVRYQRWCNHISNFLLDRFMLALEYERIKSKKYHKYNGHHWPYAYIKTLHDNNNIGKQEDNKQQQQQQQQQQSEQQQIQYNSSSSSTSLNSSPQTITFNNNNNNIIIKKDKNKQVTPVYDIKTNVIYQSLFAFIFTTRTTQIKLGIQDVPTPVAFSPVLPQIVEKRLSLFQKKVLGANPNNPTTSTTLEPYLDPLTRKLHYPTVYNNNIKKTLVDGQSLLFPSILAIIPMFYSYYFTVKHFNDLVQEQRKKRTSGSGNADKKEKEKKEKQQKDKDDVAAIATASNNTKKSSDGMPSSFGKACWARREAYRRMKERELLQKQRREEEATIKYITKEPQQQTNTTTSISTSQQADKTQDTLAQASQNNAAATAAMSKKAQQLKEKELDALLGFGGGGGSKKKKEKVKPQKKKDQQQPQPEQPEPQQCALQTTQAQGEINSPEHDNNNSNQLINNENQNVENNNNNNNNNNKQTEQQQQKMNTSVDNTNNNNNNTIVHIGPDYKYHDIITTLEDFPKPVLFNNFYDSDDDLPLLLTLGRYYDDEIAKLKEKCNNQNNNNKENENNNNKENDDGNANGDGNANANGDDIHQRLSQLQAYKDKIDSRVLSPHFKNAPHVGKLMQQAYDEAKVKHGNVMQQQQQQINNTTNNTNDNNNNTFYEMFNKSPIESFSIDEYTKLYPNQLVLGSDGYCCVNNNDNNKNDINQSDNNKQNQENISLTIALHPEFTGTTSQHKDKQQQEQALPSTSQEQNTIDMIHNDHFITKDLCYGLEMASTLTSLVLMYYGQNTHRGYADLQYTVKIGQPLVGFMDPGSAKK